MWTESVDGEKIMAQMRSGTTVFGIRGSELKALKIPLPPLALQREFVAIAEKAEAAKTALKKSIVDIDQVIKGLING
jgi:type I restriction enzyme S subunit